LKKILYLVVLFLFTNYAYSASFDCKKASTQHEKLICNNPELSEADSQLGNTYSSILKKFKFPELIKQDQRSWLYGYRNCGVIAKCLDLIKERINDLGKYEKASLYTNYKENKFIVHEGTIVVFDESNVKTARFLGNWMTDMGMDPNNIKGYPFDGVWCDLDLELIKKGNLFIPKDNYPEITLMIDATKIILKGNIMCSPRTGFTEGTYLKR